MVHYRPEPKRYSVKSDNYVLGKVVHAKQLAGVIRKVAEDAQADQQQKTDSFDHMVDLFTGAHNLGLPADKRYVSFDAKSSKPADVILRVMGMLTVEPKFQYISPRGSARDDVRRDKIEAHLNAYPKWLFRRWGQRWDYQSRFWQLLLGRGYIQQSYLPFHWDKETRKRRNGEEDGAYNDRIAGYKGYQGPPFYVEAPDPRTVFELPGTMGTSDWVKVYRVQRYQFDEAFARVGKRIELDRNGEAADIHDLSKPAGLQLPVQSDANTNNDAVDYYELLDDVYCYYVVGNTVVHKYKHDGGMKIFPAYGLQTGFKEHHLASLGILWAVRNEIPQFDFMRTLWMQKAYLDVFPQLLAQLKDNEQPIMGDDDNPQHWDIEPGTIKQVRGIVTSAMKEAGTGVDFRAAIESLAGDIDLATISGLARGIAGAQQPGYSINQLSQAMRSLWKPVISSGELQHSGFAEHYLWCNKNIVQETSSLFAEVEDPTTGRRSGEYFDLEPDDIDEYCQVAALLDPELPIDTQGNMMTWAKLHQEGMATWEEFTREGMRKTNPVERLRQVRKDTAVRVMMPKATEDAMALGRVKLTNDIIKTRGLDKLNAIGNMDIQALKLARSTQPLPSDAAGGAGEAAPTGGPLAPSGGPPGTVGGGPQVVASSAGQSGGGIPPTVGANPNDPTPGPRQ